MIGEQKIKNKWIKKKNMNKYIGKYLEGSIMNGLVSIVVPSISEKLILNSPIKKWEIIIIKLNNNSQKWLKWVTKRYTMLKNKVTIYK